MDRNNNLPGVVTVEKCGKYFNLPDVTGCWHSDPLIQSQTSSFLSIRCTFKLLHLIHKTRVSPNACTQRGDGQFKATRRDQIWCVPSADLKRPRTPRSTSWLAFPAFPRAPSTWHCPPFVRLPPQTCSPLWPRLFQSHVITSLTCVNKVPLFGGGASVSGQLNWTPAGS